AGLALATTIAVSLVFGIASSRSAERLRVALDESRRLSATLAQDRGQALCGQGDLSRGVLWLARSLEPAGLIEAPELRRGSRASLDAWCRELHPLRAMLGHEADLSAIAPSREGTLAAADPETRRPGLCDAIALAPDGTLAATGWADGAVRLWDTATAGLVA